MGEKTRFFLAILAGIVAFALTEVLAYLLVGVSVWAGRLPENSPIMVAAAHWFFAPVAGFAALGFTVGGPFIGVGAFVVVSDHG